MSLLRHHRERQARNYDKRAADREIDRQVAWMRGKRPVPQYVLEARADGGVVFEARGAAELNRRGLTAAMLLGARIIR